MNIEELIAGLKAKGLNDEAIKEELNKIKADIDAYLNPSANPEEKDDEVKEASKILDYALWLLLEAKGVEIDPNKHNHSEILKHFGIN